ncbi:RNA polymerase sigma factor SigX [Aquibacillus koreensis]|uniref:RNA polymerase sigma factor n=1 Tax=Aquibacillus koreensis TaxID=279446 RepID=A0A9X4AGA5_9BACI|nr:RNA polymerase sigma factor SigX [Aquibacillus koreensis]MCT2537421.1 RNA polymerase sigma factor SigX [Aquibacillus koreensis]MDC3418867.1 RNA polymerase sigma factor SigX [Aquibacillus koreensis]
MKTAFEDIYDQYHKDLFQFIFYMVKDKQQTEDIIQEVYIKVLKSYDTFKGESSEKTWLFSIARHVTIDFFRKQKRKRNRIIDLFDWSEKGFLIKDEHDLPEEVAVLNDEMQQVYRCLDKCTMDQKSVIILRYIQSFSIEETADTLGWSISKVKTTQHRAIKTLKDLLDTGTTGRGEGTEVESQQRRGKA